MVGSKWSNILMDLKILFLINNIKWPLNERVIVGAREWRGDDFVETAIFFDVSTKGIHQESEREICIARYQATSNWIDLFHFSEGIDKPFQASTQTDTIHFYT